MIFVFIEDGTLDVVDGLDEAKRFDPFDVESGVFIFYDEDGTWLEPRFSAPKRRGLFNRPPTPANFELIRNAELAAGIDPFEVAIAEATSLSSNKHFDSIESIRRHVASRKTKE